MQVGLDLGRDPASQVEDEWHNSFASDYAALIRPTRLRD